MRMPSRRMREVYVLRRAGFPKYRIAHALGVSPTTVKVYLNRLSAMGLPPRGGDAVR